MPETPTHPSVRLRENALRSCRSAKGILKLVILLAALSLTIKDCVSLLLAYLRQETIARSQIMNNSSMHFPDATICTYVDPVAYAYARLDIYNESAVATVLQEANASMFLLDTAQFRSELLRNKPFAKLVALYNLVLWKLSVLENGFPREFVDDRRLFESPYDWLIVHPHDKTKHRSILFVLNHLKASGMQLSMLYRQIAAAVCHEMNTTIVVRIRNVERLKDICQKEKVAWHGAAEEYTYMQRSCFVSNDADIFRYETLYDYVGVNVNSSLLYRRVWNTTMTAKPPKWGFTISFENERENRYTDQAIYFDHGTAQILQVELLSKHTKLSYARAPCTLASRYQCTLPCKISAFSKSCGCMPSSYFDYERRIGPTSPESQNNTRLWHYCGFANNDDQSLSLQQLNNSDCRNHHHNESMWNTTCLASCKETCAKDVFAFTLVDDTMHSKASDETDVRVYTGALWYIKIDEGLRLSPTDVMSGIGNVLSLYVGFSLFCVGTRFCRTIDAWLLGDRKENTT